MPRDFSRACPVRVVSCASRLAAARRASGGRRDPHDRHPVRLDADGPRRLPRRVLAAKLAAALAWCRPRFDPTRAADSLRSPELGPPRNIVRQVNDLPGILAEVTAVLARRAVLLGGLPAPADALPAGDRILAFLPRDSLFHGSSPPECDGFIDADEIPPWGTWIVLAGEVLLSWVPAAMVPGVDSAIQCNPEQSIRWASEQSMSLVQELRGLGLLR